MRKLIALLGAAGLLVGLSSSAQAGTFVPEASTLTYNLAGLPEIVVTASPGTEAQVTLQNDLSGGHVIAVSTSVFSTINLGPGTSLFTGVPLITNLKLTLHNQAGVFLDGFSTTNVLANPPVPIGPTLGGTMGFTGQNIIFAIGGIQLPVQLAAIGGPFGVTTQVTLAGNNITATGGPFITAVPTGIKITDVTSNVITIPGRGGVQGVAFTLLPTTGETVMTLSTNGGYVSLSMGEPIENSMVTVSGTNNLLSGSKQGMLTLVSPFRVFTGALAGNLPGEVRLKLVFVPEPGTVLLLVSGAVGLAVIGRRRMRNRK